MPGTDAPDFIMLRRAMLTFIAAHARLDADRIQKTRLDDRVMAAMARVPRHEFVPVQLQQFAYADGPLPIGSGKTISQPFMVALMTDLLEIDKNDTVLEVGTGLGYQTAILAELAGQVFTTEILEELAREAQRRLCGAGYDNIHFRNGDGGYGWPEHRPYDKVIVTAAAELIPPALLQQLKPGGIMVIPAGLEAAQQLLLVNKDEGSQVQTREVVPVRFSPLITSH